MQYFRADLSSLVFADHVVSKQSLIETNILWVNLKLISTLSFLTTSTLVCGSSSAFNR